MNIFKPFNEFVMENSLIYHTKQKDSGPAIEIRGRSVIFRFVIGRVLLYHVPSTLTHTRHFLKKGGEPRTQPPIRSHVIQEPGFRQSKKKGKNEG